MFYFKCLSLTFVVSLISSQTTQPPNQKSCTTKICNSESERIKNKIDLNAKPCENFYQFACGKFQPKLPDDKLEMDEFTILEDTWKDKLQEIVEERIKPTDLTSGRLIKGFYQSCMNTVAINSRRLRPIMDIINQLKGWPMLERTNWNRDAWYLQQFIQDLDFIGSPSHYLFHFSIKSDPRNTDKWVIYIDQPYLEANILDPIIARTYHILQIDVAQMFGISHSDASANMREVLNFEKQIASILISDEERMDVESIFNPMTIREFMKVFRPINWLKYLKRLMPQLANINENTIIYISNVEFFEDLEKLVSSTPKRVLANYMIWRLICDSLTFLPTEFRQRKNRFLYDITKEDKNVTRARECVELIAEQLNPAASAQYIRKNIVFGTKNDTKLMTNYMIDKLKLLVTNADWMDAEVKTKALDKLSSLLILNGFPEEHRNDEALTKYYADLTIEDKEFLKTVFKTDHFIFRKDILKYRKSYDRDYWENWSDAIEVSIFYDFHHNSIHFPAAILQLPFFNRERPNYLDYGALGYPIAHQLVNVINNEGRYYDSEGNLEDWWNDRTYNAFMAKSQCFVDQYSTLIEPTTKIKVDGLQTLTKNVADNVGIQLAYDAYQEWVHNQDLELPLPNLKYTPNQLFWIAAAQTWCQNIRPEKLEANMKSKIHAPRQFRVNVPFSNSPSFLEDWKCPVGKMNPIVKCKL